ncbi:MAG: hypothetical protein JO344_15290 [Planctomycetaceae bacterium]|nr:hypothetical protein [Planctomycetaceae bacterium]
MATQLPDWLPGQWSLTEYSVTFQAKTTTFPAGTGPIQMAMTLAFMQGATTYDYAGGPVPPGEGDIVSADESLVSITLWPTNVPSLPATIARAAKGIVVEFSHTIWGNEPSDFKAYYEPV